MQGICTGDRELIQKALAGDRRSLESLARTVWMRVYPYMLRVLLDTHKAEDLAQDTLVAFLGSLSQIRQVDRFWPWVFTIASNEIKQRHRIRATRRTVPASGADMNLGRLESHLNEDGPGVLGRQESLEILHRAMDGIDKSDHAILRLRFHENLPNAEIASSPGCSRVAARPRLFRAKHALRRRLVGLCSTAPEWL